MLVYGKSFMSNCIAYELLKKGKTVLYQTAPILLESVIDYKFNKNKNYYNNNNYDDNNIYNSILTADLIRAPVLFLCIYSSSSINACFPSYSVSTYSPIANVV